MGMESIIGVMVVYTRVILSKESDMVMEYGKMRMSSLRVHTD